MNKIRLFLVGTLVMLFCSSVFLLIYSSVATIDKQVVDTTITINQTNPYNPKITITEFTPAWFVTDDFVYGTEENNEFNVNEIWFFVQLDGIDSEFLGNSTYQENYVMFLSIVDKDSNIMFDFNNTLIFSSNDAYNAKVTSEAVRFKLNTELFSNGLYYLRLSVIDLVSGESDYYDNTLKLVG